MQQPDVRLLDQKGVIQSCLGFPDLEVRAYFSFTWNARIKIHPAPSVGCALDSRLYFIVHCSINHQSFGATLDPELHTLLLLIDPPISESV